MLRFVLDFHQDAKAKPLCNYVTTKMVENVEACTDGVGNVLLRYKITNVINPMSLCMKFCVHLQFLLKVSDSELLPSRTMVALKEHFSQFDHSTKLECNGNECPLQQSLSFSSQT